MKTLRAIRGGAARLLRTASGRTLRSALSLSDAALLRQLRLPGAGADRPPAADELDEHFRMRARAGTLTFPGHLSPADSASRTALHDVARDVVAHRFTHGDEPAVSFGPEVDWRFDPTNDPRKRWARELSQHLWLRALTCAWQDIGEERFARTYVELMESWIRASPPPPERDESHVQWNLMNVGLRCMTWPVAFLAFYGSASFTLGHKLLVLRSMLDHGRFLRLFRTHGNHVLREANGLANLAGWFPEFREAQGWRDTALRRLTDELAEEVNDDGSHFEMSVSYQWMVIEEFEATREITERFDWRLPGVDLDDGIHRLYRVLAQLRAPSGLWPQLNDGFFDDWRVHEQRLAAAALRFDDPQLARAERTVSDYLPDAGVAVMRGFAGPECRYLLIKAGPYGGLHGHEDKLAIEVHLGGHGYLVDPGTYTYNAADPYRAYFVSSHAHNTVLVDGHSQVRRWQPEHRTPRKSRTSHGSWLSNDRFDFFTGRYDDGYGAFTFYLAKGTAPEIDRSVSHVRSVLFVKPDYWIVIDDFIARGSHEYTRVFQAGEHIELEPTTYGAVFRAADGPALLVAAAEDPAGSETLEGLEDPIAGWVSNGARYHKAPAPQLRLTSRAVGPVHLVTLLKPEPAEPVGGGWSSIERIENGDDAGTLKLLVITRDWCDHVMLTNYHEAGAAGIHLHREATDA